MNLVSLGEHLFFYFDVSLSKTTLIKPWAITGVATLTRYLPIFVLCSLGIEFDGLGADGSKGEGHVCIEHLLVSNLVMIALH